MDDAPVITLDSTLVLNEQDFVSSGDTFLLNLAAEDVEDGLLTITLTNVPILSFGSLHAVLAPDSASSVLETADRMVITAAVPTTLAAGVFLFEFTPACDELVSDTVNGQTFSASLTYFASDPSGLSSAEAVVVVTFTCAPRVELVQFPSGTQQLLTLSATMLVLFTLLATLYMIRWRAQKVDTHSS